MSRREWIVLGSIAVLVSTMIALEPDHAAMEMGGQTEEAVAAEPGESVVHLEVSGMT